MTPAAHLLSGYLAGGALAEKLPAGGARVLTAAVIGSVAPDFDVAPGLLGGWAGAGLHRGATHSFLGAAVTAWLIASVLGRPRRALFTAAFSGILTHIFWDWLNPWGVVAFWPWRRPFRGNLVHESDLYALTIVAAGAILLWRGRRGAALAAVVLALAAYLSAQVWWRNHARGLAHWELAGRRWEVYPAGRLQCGWIVLSSGNNEMAVDCVRSPLARHLQPVFRATSREDALAGATLQSAAVREFRQKIPFPFAEVRAAGDGGAVVIWRDLRVAYQEDPHASPAGLYVRLDAAGNIVSERHRWWLRLW